MQVALSVVWALGLALAAGAKIIAPQRSRDGLANLGFATPRRVRIAWLLAIVVELACAVAVALRPAAGFFAASALFLVFAVIILRAQLAGASGRPCGCLGSRGTISFRAALGNLGIAIASLVIAVVAVNGLTFEVAVIAGGVALFCAIVVLGAVVIALAREVGILKLALSSSAALELPGEGPEIGSMHNVEPWTGGADVLVLAVFTSEGCPMCRNLGPSLQHLRSDPHLRVLELDESRDAAAWSSFDAPGSPYAVALSQHGEVLAKGTFNGLAQLESIIATASHRVEEAARV